MHLQRLTGHVLGCLSACLLFSLLWTLVLLACPIGRESIRRLDDWLFSDHAAPIATILTVLPNAAIPAAIFHVACLAIQLRSTSASLPHIHLVTWYLALAFATFTVEFAIWRLPWEWSLVDFFAQLLLYQLAAVIVGAISVAAWLMVIRTWPNKRMHKRGGVHPN